MAAPACDSDEKREIAFLRITTSNSVETLATFYTFWLKNYRATNSAKPVH